MNEDVDFSDYPNVSASRLDNGSCKIMIERFDALPELSESPTVEKLTARESSPATESRLHEFQSKVSCDLQVLC